MAEEKIKGMGGLSKMGSEAVKPPKPPAAPRVHEPSVGGEQGGEKTHTVHDHGDGTFHSVTHDGQQTEHPDHLHMLAHLGHHITGGDKHHVVHHDGMMAHSHGIHEDGGHEGSHDHENLDELKSSMDQFLNEEGQQGGGGEQEAQAQPEEQQPAYGGMSA